MKVFYTHTAIEDLQRLYGFIANENPRAAAEVSARLRQAIKRLIDFPMLAREIKSGKNQFHCVI